MLNLGLTDTELAQLRSDMLGIVNGRPYDIILTRRGVELPEQRCRAERTKFRLVEKDGPMTKTVGQELRVVIVIAGGIDLDIERGDEFFFEGNMYRVEEVDPNHDIGITARAEISQ